jgi:hypothetical protein
MFRDTILPSFEPPACRKSPSTAFRKYVYTVRPELVEGHELRFDKLSANGGAP